MRGITGTESKQRELAFCPKQSPTCRLAEGLTYCSAALDNLRHRTIKR